MDRDESEQSADHDAATWQFKDETHGASVAHETSVAWTASEYVGQEKTAVWFIGLAGASLALALLVFFMTKRDLFAPIMILVFGATFGAFAARQPRVLEYALGSRGLQVGPKLYVFEHFKSFSVIEEGAIHSILLTPMQRFMPPLSIYYAPEDEANIVQALGNYLPHEEHAHDLVDRLVRRIRF